MRMETLREFIEFAKYQNISVAAKKLFITQPALSNHIASLEKELGIDLVRRSATLELTEAGRAFFEGCCEVVGTFDEMVERVRTLAEEGGRAGMLTIKAEISSQSGSMRLRDLVTEFRHTNPMVTVKMGNIGRHAVVDDLASGVIDCAQMYNFVPENGHAAYSMADVSRMGTDFVSLVIDRAPITLVAAKDHPLMSKPAVAFSDILDYPYAMPAGAQFEECEISVRELFAKHGAELRNIHYKIVDSLADLITMKTQGQEVIISGANPALPEHMSFRRFEPAEYQNFCLVWRADNPNPALADFIDLVRRRTQ